MILKQLVALILVRRQISKNQRRAAGFANVVLANFITYAIRLLGFLSFFISIYAGAVWLRDVPSSKVYLTWSIALCAFMFFWLTTLLDNVQQKDMISIEKLLHTPVSLKSAFVLNYFSSLGSTVFLLLAPTLVGLSIGMTIGRGQNASVSIALIISFLFFVTACSYLIQGWAGNAMKNKRTRGIVLAGVPFVFVIALLLSMFFDFEYKELFSSDFEFLPAFGWIPSDIVRAENGTWWPSILSTITMIGFSTASLFFSYNASLRAYTGVESKRDRKKGTRQATNWSDTIAFKKVPYISEPACAVAYSTYKNLIRAPEALMALLPLLVLLVFGSPYLLKVDGFVIPEFVKLSLPYGIVFVTMIGFPAFLFSTFSYDRDGFRAYMLSPVRRSEVLLGKNLAIGLLTIVSGWVLVSIAQVFVPQDLASFISTLLQIPATFLLMCVLGNTISIFFPIGLMRGSMKPVNAAIIPSIIVYFGILIGPAILLTPMSFAAGIPMLIEFATGASMGWLYLLVTIIQLVVSWFFYLWTLNDMGHWLWSQEPRILETVANIPE